jgi:predicted nuclease of predicted toxin-antitoxin system
MKLLLDQDVSAGAAEILRAAGTDVVHAREVALSRTQDVDILAWCRDNGRVLVSLDGDFHALLALSGATSPSVIRIRIEGLRDRAMAALITRVIDTTADDLIRGSAVTVKVKSIRVHRLPLGRLK